MCRATNDWQRDAFTRRDRRIKGGLVVPYEDGAASAAEIERCGADTDFAQVFLLTRSQEPLGNRQPQADRLLFELTLDLAPLVFEQALLPNPLGLDLFLHLATKTGRF